MTTIDVELSKAIVLWTGVHTNSWPRRDDQVVIDTYGRAQAIELVPRIRAASREFYDSDAFYTAPDQDQMVAQARERFVRLRPDVSAEAVDALAWCYSFDYR